MDTTEKLAAMFLALSLSGCAEFSNSCPAGLEPMLQADLYFGRAIKSGGMVSDEDWRRFVDEEITPRFPDGLTIADTAGQWRDRNGIVREPSKRLTIVLPTQDSARLDAIRTAYRQRFRQDSVLLLETRACGAF